MVISIPPAWCFSNIVVNVSDKHNVTYLHESKMPSGIRANGQSMAKAKKLGAVLIHNTFWKESLE